MSPSCSITINFVFQKEPREIEYSIIYAKHVKYCR